MDQFLKKVDTVIEYNRNVWLKPYIGINADLRKKAKNDFGKDFLKLIDNAVFRKNMKNVTKHRGIKLVTIERRRKYFVPEPKCHAITFFAEYLLELEIKNSEMLRNKPVYLGLQILELSKILMYQFVMSI